MAEVTGLGDALPLRKRSEQTEYVMKMRKENAAGDEAGEKRMNKVKGLLNKYQN